MVLTHSSRASELGATRGTREAPPGGFRLGRVGAGEAGDAGAAQTSQQAGACPRRDCGAFERRRRL